MYKMNMQEPEQSIHLADYYYVLLKYKWLIISAFVITLGLTVFFTLRMTPIYSATATMVIDNQKTKSPLTGEAIDYGSYVSQTISFNTHLNLITSRPVLEKVIRTYKLDRADAGNKDAVQIASLGDLLNYFRENLRRLMGEKEKVLTAEDKRELLIQRLRRKINVSEVRDTLLLKITVEDPDPVMAKNIANTLAQAYIEFDTTSKVKSSQNTMSWMTAQLYETQKKLEDAEAEFLGYKQDEKLFSIQGKQNLITQKIEDFNNSYIEARNRRMELDAKLEKLKRSLRSEGEILYARSLIDNSLIESLYTQLHESEVELNRLNNIFKSKHPKIVQLVGKIEETRKKLNEEIKKEIENLKAERSVLYTKEKILQETISGFESDALETGKKELQYTILQRNLNTNQKLYDILLSKIKEANIEDSLDVSNIRITEEAVTPLAPIKPKKKQNILIGAILGLMTGIGFSFLWEYLDRTIRTEDDVQKYLELPVLSVIPEAELP
jgi:uncharacterized protein involved in exopolysaccharide biosynthesis